jgi:GNAT superfamily N-acetyltransferase
MTENRDRGCEDVLELGPLQPGDRAAVLDVFEGLSDVSRRLRFHGPKPRLQDRELDMLVDVGCCGREAVAAVERPSGRVVGIARFVREHELSRSAEVAFAVVDRCQGLGIGSTLVEELRELALRQGIELFTAAVSPGNEPAFALMRRAGRVVRSTFADGAYEVVVELAAQRRVA